MICLFRYEYFFLCRESLHASQQHLMIEEQKNPSILRIFEFEVRSDSDVTHVYFIESTFAQQNLPHRATTTAKTENKLHVI